MEEARNKRMPELSSPGRAAMMTVADYALSARIIEAAEFETILFTRRCLSWRA